MPQETISIPILCIAKSGFLTAVADRDALEICGQSALASGYFDGMLLVDSMGRSYQVHSAAKVANIGRLVGRRLLASRRIRVRLELAEGRVLTLSELQELISHAIDRLPAQWEAVEETTHTKARVRGAETICELIGLFAKQSQV